jgi:hypothetical protein
MIMLVVLDASQSALCPLLWKQLERLIALQHHHARQQAG